MSVHLTKELETLRHNILIMGATVEEAIAKAMYAVQNRDAEAARRIQANDRHVDAMEVEIESECLRILALHQPVAKDLRFVISVFKINNDLERIGDIAVNIARRAYTLALRPPDQSMPDFEPMAQQAQRMLREALNALVLGDSKLALQVCAEDDRMDTRHNNMQTLIEMQMRKQPEDVHLQAQYLSISRHLERIADLATNIAEDVIYMTDGIIVRHQIQKYSNETRWSDVDNTCVPNMETGA